ncbi:HAD family hydrolase [Ectothiorhodospira mobilis]|uniref:HAD family hydrolase n=1 Tax=Ectothiorhodospira mobilis TaxID=195064 RepID=UPI001EE8B3AA|nr:HAD-IA family hydrolase [Ectothiorhodospira mobilis]MCG5535028.1 HAD-IA family hydrolase [Ectothiorhodospira mobilis]
MKQIRNYQLLVFDWDGTLMDSIGRIVHCLQGAIHALGLEERPRQALKDVIGLGLRDAILQLYPEADEALCEAFTHAYRERYLGDDPTPSPLFPGVPQVLADLEAAGYWLGVATGMSRKGLDRKLTSTGLGSRFLVTRCAEEAFSKPHPALLQAVMDYAGVPPEETLMIGDSVLDLQMAANACTDGVGVTTGVHDAGRLAPHAPRILLDDLRQLPHWLATGGVRALSDAS